MYMRTDFRIRNIHVIANNELCTIFVVNGQQNLALSWTTNF